MRLNCVLSNTEPPSCWQGTESEHGVPVPLPDCEGRDVERGCFTRVVAQSCRPDDCLDDLAFDAARTRPPEREPVRCPRRVDPSECRAGRATRQGSSNGSREAPRLVHTCSEALHTI